MTKFMNFLIWLLTFFILTNLGRMIFHNPVQLILFFVFIVIVPLDYDVQATVQKKARESQCTRQ